MANAATLGAGRLRPSSLLAAADVHAAALHSGPVVTHTSLPIYQIDARFDQQRHLRLELRHAGICQRLSLGGHPGQ
jgi:hypothetical protein